MTLLWILLFLVVLWTLAYARAPLWAATAALGGTLWLWGLASEPSALCQGLVWLVFVVLAVPLNVPPLRRVLVSNRVLEVFRRIMPRMSQTEREALEAGSVWWDGELFSGRPRWDKLMDTPAPTLSADERAFLDGPVEELCAMLDDWHITHEALDLPAPVWAFIKARGFFGMIIPKRYGGLEFSALGHSSVVMKISSRSTTAAVTVMVPNSLGPAELLLRYGTEAQKDHYLPRLARGEEVPCFALTSPEAGSDAAAMTDTGVVCKGEFEGRKDVLGIRLNWEKRYITLGPVATVLGLAFKLYDPDRLLGETAELGITCALIPTNTPGVEIGNRHFPLDIAFQNGPNRGRDVFIPVDWIIGGPERAGQGWRMLMECLAAGRSISLPALSTGAGKLMCRATGAYARVRKQFKTPIGRFEGVEEALARMAAYTYLMDAARTLTAAAVDLGESPSVASAIVKYNLTERMRQVVGDAMDIQGGSGICMGPRNIWARVYQAVPISITVEGANILTRSLIIFGQGAVRCHPYVLKEMRATQEENTVKARRDFDRALFGHMGFAISNAARALFLGISGARFTRTPGEGAVRRCYQQLSRMSAALALTADVAMLILGGELKRKEKLSGRLADVLSQLYLASATLKRFHDQGLPPEDLPLVQWACDDALHKMQESLVGMLQNFPNRPAAWLLRQLIFPTGLPYGGPSDRLGHTVADLLLKPSEGRDRLTRGIYTPTATDQTLGRLEHALQAMLDTEALEKKLAPALRAGELRAGDPELYDKARAKGYISQSEQAQLLAADQARKDALAVDEFTPAQLAARR